MSEHHALCVVGSVNLDVVVVGDRLPGPGETVLGTGYAEYPGGKGLNQAVAAARAGVLTKLCACVGSDDAGTMLRRVASDAGIGLDNLETLESVRTGRALIATSPNERQNQIMVYPGANALLMPAAAARGVRGARVVLAQLEVAAETVVAAFREARARGAITILNPAPAAAASEELLSLCDFAIPNESEAAELGGVEAMRAAGVGAVIVTLGPRGASVNGPKQPELLIDTPNVDVVDTTAAGDAFCGAFAAAISQGAAVADATRFGTAAGAVATTRPGAVPSLPTRVEIDALLSQQLNSR
jgi:ribokinase